MPSIQLILNQLSYQMHSQIAELPCFPQKFRGMTVQEVSADPKLIEELYHSREGMQAQAKYSLGCKPKVREMQLINSLDEIYQIDAEKAKAKVVLGRYSDSQQTYCYAVEVAIAPRTDVGTEYIGEVEIIDSINDLTSSDGGGTYISMVEIITGLEKKVNKKV